MIDFVRGRLVHKDPAYVVVDVNGVGYRVGISLTTFSALGKEENVKLYTYFHVREDIQALYGFWEEQEREFFKALISISGVGPNTALVMLSSLTPQELQRAILQGDINTIQSIKGIGGKTAQRIILELKDKVGKIHAAEGTNISGTVYNTVREESLSALVTLGIAKSVAEKAVDRYMKQSGDIATVEEIIKAVLKSS